MIKDRSVLSTSKPFDSIVIGVTFHTIAIIFVNLTNILPGYIVITLFGWFFFIKGFFKIRNELGLSFEGWYKILLGLYFLFLFIMIIRSYLDSSTPPWKSFDGMINYNFFQQFGLPAYIMPLVLFIPYNLIDFKKLIKISIIFSWFVIISFLVLRNKILQASVAQVFDPSQDINQMGYLYYGQIYTNVVLIALCNKFISKKIWILNTVALFVTLLINIMCGRRGNSLVTFCFFSFDIFIFVSTVKSAKKVLLIIFLCIVGYLMFYYFYYSNYTIYILERGLADNRSSLTIDLLRSLNESNSFVFGKGLFGKYYSSAFQGYRMVHESGYYNLLLKGGYLFTWTYILIFLIPAIRGLIYSQNLFCKIYSIFIILNLLQLYTFGHFTFNLNFFFLWIGIIICMNDKFLKMKNEEIYNHLFKISTT